MQEHMSEFTRMMDERGKELQNAGKPALGDPGLSETTAEKGLRDLVDAEANYLKAGYDNTDGKRHFAFGLATLFGTKDAAGKEIRLIPKELAAGEKDGYRFGTLGTYDQAGGKDPRYGFAYYAIPKNYGAGCKTYIVNLTGVIYWKDLGKEGKPPSAWPTVEDPKKDGWTPLWRHELLKERAQRGRDPRPAPPRQGAGRLRPSEMSPGPGLHLAGASPLRRPRQGRRRYDPRGFPDSRRFNALSGPFGRDA